MRHLTCAAISSVHSEDQHHPQISPDFLNELKCASSSQLITADHLSEHVPEVLCDAVH